LLFTLAAAVSIFNFKFFLYFSCAKLRSSMLTDKDNKLHNLSQTSSLKVVLFYVLISTIYIYTSDYFLKILVKDIELLTSMQTYKGLGFIFITSLFLYILVKKNLEVNSTYYHEILAAREVLDNQIKESQQEYLSLFNHSPLPVWIVDINTHQFIDVNDAACKVYGYTKDEYLTMTLKDIRPSEEIPSFEELISSQNANTQATFSNTRRHKKKNGDLMEVKIISSVLTFGGKQVRLVSAVDVSNEIATQNQLKEFNARLKLASEIAGLGYWTNDFIKSEITWSDEIYKIFEVNPDSFVLTLENISSRFHPDERSNFLSNNFYNFENNSVMESEHRILTDSGNTKWILERKCFIKDNDKPIKLVGITLDITKRKLHEQELLESNERFKILTKATVEAIIDWDIKNNKVVWGEGFQTLLGYDINAGHDDLWSSNIHPEDKENVLLELNKVLSDPNVFQFNAEFRFLRADRSIAYMQHKGVFMRDKEGKATRALGAMIDLTESLERIRKIEVQNKALKDIAWAQSHLVRAPLANILGLTELLKDNINSDTENAKLIDYLRESAEKLDAVINDIVNKTADR
jgi:PAS domain S-box-containing protein